VQPASTPTQDAQTGPRIASTAGAHPEQGAGVTSTTTTPANAETASHADPKGSGTNPRGAGARPNLPSALAIPTSASRSTSAEPVSAGITSLNPAESSASAGEASPLLSSGVGMQDMIDSIRATIELASAQGTNQARIALQPAELGEIRIHLSQNAEGLVARVTADTPAAAQALAQGRTELHQSLSALGTPLLRLDVGAFGQSQTGERDGRTAGEPGSPSRSATTSTTHEDDGSAETIGELESVSPTAGLASGGLVNVLA
jgi:flagellar hook-length control protein FliK